MLQNTNRSVPHLLASWEHCDSNSLSSEVCGQVLLLLDDGARDATINRIV
jgi:hypothetical protein